MFPGRLDWMSIPGTRDLQTSKQVWMPCWSRGDGEVAHHSENRRPWAAGEIDWDPFVTTGRGPPGITPPGLAFH